jgi:NTE family protein
MASTADHGWFLGRWYRAFQRRDDAPPLVLSPAPTIGLALGGGFARGIAHVGVLKVFEQYQIPIHYIAGVSAGSMVAAAYASGSTPEEIGRIGASMRFGDVARWSISKMGLAGSDRMNQFLQKLLKSFRFEDMKIPLGVVATDLATGNPVLFHDSGDVLMAIRASCSYPGLFQPLAYEGRLLVDGAMSMEVPSPLLRTLGATRVISVHLPMQQAEGPAASNMFQVINRCFQIMQTHAEQHWREQSDLVIAPDVTGMEWDAFGSAEKLVQAGEIAALEAVPKIKAWLPDAPAAAMTKPLSASPSPSGSSPATA